ncbi:hypothetical protein ABB26_08395 [Stenotrophomonas humi]|uniref:Uncharacterized protein n=1 Tax=Stenotrophomonas humi TaxID=405444 RepID=A0A0R0C492_9GAMM|nr:hypothetical protein [Stenotrophomonas humi]KRG64341.1 hypothetical protein ABB26_08395 [Stenotrophomonas humi]
MTLSITPGHASETGAATEESATPPVAAALAIAPLRRQHLIQLEQAAQQEIALLRTQCTTPEMPDWLASSIDWDLSAL